jgi:hypothetical protein
MKWILPQHKKSQHANHPETDMYGSYPCRPQAPWYEKAEAFLSGNIQQNALTYTDPQPWRSWFKGVRSGYRFLFFLQNSPINRAAFLV